MYSYGSPHMAAQKQDDQHERTFSSYVRIQVVVLKTYLGRWTIGRSGERGSGISVLPARYDDDDDELSFKIFSRFGRGTPERKNTPPYIYIYIYIWKESCQPSIIRGECGWKRVLARKGVAISQVGSEVIQYKEIEHVMTLWTRASNQGYIGGKQAGEPRDDQSNAYTCEAKKKKKKREKLIVFSSGEGQIKGRGNM